MGAARASVFAAPKKGTGTWGPEPTRAPRGDVAGAGTGRPARGLLPCGAAPHSRALTTPWRPGTAGSRTAEQAAATPMRWLSVQVRRGPRPTGRGRRGTERRRRGVTSSWQRRRGLRASSRAACAAARARETWGRRSETLPFHWTLWTCSILCPDHELPIQKNKVSI